ncbi:ferredoxin [Candidatus Poriferisocius sp.]|uniref:ferredoxin n=1 Tax=Candidatus Poriferisocius sp. TaxID=3101276 RepID=UPI003B021DAE
MRIRVDTKLCQGHGRCYMLAPDLFDADDDGYSQPTVERTVGPELADQARRAFMNCPEDAIILTEETR